MTPPEIKKEKKKPISQEDYFKLFRTRLVLFWVFCNAALIVAMTFKVNDKTGGGGCVNERTFVVMTSNGVTTNYYLATILWTVALLVRFKFI
jgi:chitin synthase